MKYETIVKKVRAYNKEFQNIKEHGYRPKSLSYSITSTFAEFIAENSNKGKILTYKKALDRLAQKGYDVEDFTKEYYTEKVSELLNEIGRYKTYKGYIEEVRNDLTNKIKIMDEYYTSIGLDLGYSIDDIDEIPLDDLFNIFKEANELKTKQKPSDNSFYIELDNLISNYLQI